MNKLEYHILKLFQEMVLKEQKDIRYIELENNLIALIKTEDELDLFIKTELVLDGRALPTFGFSKVIEGLYKIQWTDMFLYLVGDKGKESISPNTLTKELELLRVSSSPLSNYIKTL